MLAKTIAFALNLNYANTESNTISQSELLSILESHISVVPSEDELKNEQLDLELSRVYIRHRPDETNYTLLNQYEDKRVVANTPITKYILKDVKKQNDEFFATYDKYIIETPYKAINRTSQDSTKGEHSINAYLDGHGTPLSIKEIITPENIIDIAEPESELRVIYKFQNNQILFEKIDNIWPFSHNSFIINISF